MDAREQKHVAVHLEDVDDATHDRRRTNEDKEAFAFSTTLMIVVEDPNASEVKEADLRKVDYDVAVAGDGLIQTGLQTGQRGEVELSTESNDYAIFRFLNGTLKLIVLESHP